jgi:hypothetical protein
MSNGGIIGPVVNPISGATSTTYTSFDASGTFTAQTGQTKVDLLIVAGGGGGWGAGGGAGGFRLLTCQAVPSSSVPITVGAGGTGNPASTPAAARDGTPSIFGASIPLASTGGGGGQGCQGQSSLARPGGSGGGTASSPGSPYAAGTGNAGGYSPPEGNPGAASNTYNGTGGGGASTAGNNSPGWPGPGGPGGNGSPAAPIFGSAPQPYYNQPNGETFAGGGGGGGSSAGGSGGPGGGGAGTGTGVPTPATPATINSGSGGGGNYGAAEGGNGGSGKIIVKQPAQSYFTAPGIWSLSDAYNYKKAGNWGS